KTRRALPRNRAAQPRCSRQRRAYVRYNSGKDYPHEWLVGTAAAPVTKLYSTTTFDLLGKYHVSKNIHVNFNIDNLTNRYAFDPGTVIYMPIPGRTFRLGVEATF
ncbi:hypothetical protein AB7X03_19675, partial [Providencia rettgeri]